MAKKVDIKANKIKKRNKRYSKTKIILSAILLFFIFSFIILSIIYKGGKFTITLDQRLATDNHIVIYEDSIAKDGKRK